MQRETIAKEFVGFLETHVGVTPESQGSNRSPIIDSFNKRAGVPMGSPYCLAGATSVLDDACRALKCKNPVGVHGGTQEWFNSAPAKYVSRLGKKGSIAIFRDRGDHAHGHAASVVLDQQAGSKVFHTIEFNSDGEGSREGDNCYSEVRSIDGTEGLELRGFIDVCQWIVDYNS